MNAIGQLLDDVLTGAALPPVDPRELAALIGEAGVMRQQALHARLKAHPDLAGDTAAANRVWDAAICILAVQRGWDDE